MSSDPQLGTGMNGSKGEPWDSTVQVEGQGRGPGIDVPSTLDAGLLTSWLCDLWPCSSLDKMPPSWCGIVPSPQHVGTLILGKIWHAHVHRRDSRVDIVREHQRQREKGNCPAL